MLAQFTSQTEILLKIQVFWDMTKCNITEDLNLQQHCYENLI